MRPYLQRKFRLIALIPLVLVVAACSNTRQTFRLSGEFKGFNQGELYIYDIDGQRKLDTIGVKKGQFVYEIPLEDSTLFVIVFPNFTELPVFGCKGAEVEIKGDASHLKETAIKGTDENKLMTAFRRETAQQTPLQQIEAAEAFIHEHPASPFARYLLQRYFLQPPRPDYDRASRLITIISKARPQEQSLKALSQGIKGLKQLREKQSLPTFAVKDVAGKTVKSSTLNGDVNVITLWAKWNYESQSIQRQLLPLKHEFDDRLQILSICIDADAKECRRTVEKDSLPWSTICDGKMWQTPIIKQLGLSYVPDNILIDGKGKIISHSLRQGELINTIREHLK